jgi:hypothetical protein
MRHDPATGETHSGVPLYDPSTKKVVNLYEGWPKPTKTTWDVRPSMAQSVWDWVRKYGVAIVVSVGFWWLMVYVLMSVL